MKRPVLLAAVMLTSTAATAGDGQAIAFNCLTCHNADNPADAPPPLPALGSRHILAALTAFKYDRKPATIMPRIAKGYSDAELAQVAELLGNGRP